MPEEPFTPVHVYVEEEVVDLPLAKRVLSRLPGVRPVILAAGEAPPQLEEGEAHHALLLARQRGRFVKSCPGTKGDLCCGYLNINVAMGCDLGCEHCVLQGYLSKPITTLFVNTEDLWHELDELMQQTGRVVRIGSGELADSLAFDHLTDLNQELVRYFAEQRQGLFELKTKSDRIEPLLEIDHRGRTVLSWSLNSEAMRTAHRAKTAPLTKRLEAARRAQEAGYRLGFHFDPLIWYEGWQQDYQEVVDQLFHVVRPENIAWISLGALRYPAQMDRLIRTRYPGSVLPVGEFVPGEDGKWRYFRPLREEMFRCLYQRIKLYAPQAAVYLCMESGLVWRRSFGWSPKDSAGLARLLDQRVLLP